MDMNDTKLGLGGVAEEFSAEAGVDVDSQANDEAGAEAQAEASND
ncbi:MAG: hypothetical protein WB424_00290 [Terracidiphilus sp.]